MGKYAPRSELQKGGCAGSRRRAVIGLGLILGPTPKEVWTGMRARLVTRIRSLMGKAAHLCRVKDVACHSLFREGTANAAGKELHEVLINL